MIGGLLIAGAGAFVGIKHIVSGPKAGADVIANGTPKHPFVGTSDKVPKVLGGVKNWQGLVGLVDKNPTKFSWYPQCFAQQTGHSWFEAENAAILEKQGWNEAVTIVSNTTTATVDAQLAAQHLKRDPDLVFTNGFENTEGLPSNMCHSFFDSRSQARIALTLPGKDKHTAGLPVVLAHCGNPLPQPTHPPVTPVRTHPTPSGPTPTHHVPNATPPTTPVTVPPTTPTTVRKPKCASSVLPPAGPYCETRNINTLPATQHRTDPGPTPGATRGSASKTRQEQAPSQTPNPVTGSRVPEGTTVPITNPPTAPPDTGQTVGDPCNGDPNCGG